jgi:hypothetical protein
MIKRERLIERLEGRGWRQLRNVDLFKQRFIKKNWVCVVDGLGNAVFFRMKK